MAYTVNIKGHYYYFRRVPAEVAEYDERKHVKISLKTTDEKEAERKARIYNDFIEDHWRTLIKTGDKVNGEAKYRAAIQIAREYGFAYRSAAEVMRSPVEEFMARLEAAQKSPIVGAATMGLVPPPKIMLSDCPKKYLPLTIDRLQNKSEHQKRKWKNPRLRAWSDFIQCVGDKPLSDLMKRDALDYWKWLNECLEDGQSPETLNKKIRHVKDISNTVASKHEIELPPLFDGLKFQLHYNTRPPFDPAFIKEMLLPGIEGLNDEAKFIVYVMADTGARVSEIVGLDKEDIILDGVPHIDIRPKEGHALKTRHSARKIPLVGAALLACQKMPKGTSYKIPDHASNTINKFLKENGLLPTESHSLYSLRHTFKDRLRDIEAPQEMINELMGHSTDLPEYGRGHKLEKKHEWLTKIAFSPLRF